MSRFDETLNACYVPTLLSRSRGINPDQLESYARHYAHTFGPLLPQNRDAHILDIGCGLGQFLYFLKREGYRNHWGIDIGQEQVDLCREHITDQVDRVASTATYLCEREASYDAIVLIDVLEHIGDEDLFPLLDAIKRALVPAGVILISVPNAACVTALVTRYGDLTHKRLFTEVSLTQLLLTAGFQNVSMLPNEKKVIRSFSSRRHRWAWKMREKLARWLLSELHRHLMEGSYPTVQTVNILGVARTPPESLNLD